MSNWDETKDILSHFGIFVKKLFDFRVNLGNRNASHFDINDTDAYVCRNLPLYR